MGVEEVEPDGAGVVLGEDVLHGEEVAKGLGHLLLLGHSVALDLQHSVVHPVVGQGLASDGFRLQDLVLVVGEDKVVATAVDVDLLAQVAVDHCRALDVPSGPALSPGGVPGDLAGFGGLPDGEVKGPPLVGVGGDAAGGLELVHGLVGEPAVVLHLGDVEVDAAVVGHVGVAVVDDPLDH